MLTTWRSPGLTLWLACLVTPLLAGCSVSGLLPDWSSPDRAGPEPPARFIIANHLTEIVGDPAKAGTFEVSKARRVDSLKGASWVVCVRTHNFPRLPVYYAVFLQDTNIVDSRISVVIDQCELQTFAPYDWAVDKNNPDAH